MTADLEMQIKVKLACVMLADHKSLFERFRGSDGIFRDVNDSHSLVMKLLAVADAKQLGPSILHLNVVH
ncbi:MAG: hypothetical protein H0V76_09930 [Blastocatellia bacterium]|nr:hypothetical protein [Blastocatellia bacterium]